MEDALKEKAEREARKALGEPFAADFSDYTRKLRMNLIVASFVALVVVYAHVSILPSSTFFGLTFKGVSDRLILFMLLFINIYTTLHFLWCSADHLLEWLIRLSGARVAFQTGSSYGNSHVDYPKEPRQSTLYNWWLLVGRDLPDIKKGTEKLLVDFEALDKKFNKTQLETPGSVAEIVGQMNALRLELQELDSGIRRTIVAMDAPRLTVSLARFDSAFRRMLMSQNLRWLILEVGVPALMGIFAVVMLSIRIYQGAGFGWLTT